MKLSALTLLAAAATSCFAQSVVHGSGGSKTLQSGSALSDLDTARRSNVGCPVMLTSANLTPKGQYLPVRADTGEGKNGDLHLAFRNMSGKRIESVGIMAELKVKRSLYDLDSITIDVHLEFAGTAIVDKDRDVMLTIPIAKRALGLGSVILDTVTYSDGTVWKAGDKRNGCSVAGGGTLALGIAK
jgi:hypothetical protein